MNRHVQTSRAPLAERVEQLAATRYVIVFAIRSGSTLLCSDLAQAGLGAPTEHFQGPVLSDSVAARLERLVAADAPIFGTKLSWEQAFALFRHLADEGEIGAFDLREGFGRDVKVIRLVRRNKIRQAVSAWRAATSGVWHLPAGTVSDGREPPYERAALMQLTMQLLTEDWLWERHLGDAGLDTLTVTYEDYVEDRLGWVAAIAAHVGHALDRAPSLRDVTRPMADQWTDRLEDRLLDDLSAPIHPFWATPDLRDCVPASLPVGQCLPPPRSAPYPAGGAVRGLAE